MKQKARLRVAKQHTNKLVEVVLKDKKDDGYKVLWGDEIEFWFASRCELQ